MKLERDKFYKTRDGRKVRVIAVDVEGSYKIAVATNDGSVYQLTENLLFYGSGKESGSDIISEWIDEPLMVKFEGYSILRDTRIGLYFDVPNSILRPFIGKKTKVTIEEVRE